MRLQNFCLFGTMVISDALNVVWIGDSTTRYAYLDYVYRRTRELQRSAEDEEEDANNNNNNIL